ncbi:transcriptional regulator, LacI family [Candidatus Koribacter versatilis Ellin345]|uniref:Transcriptional regulator, LacI family n=1 Tax=Koribacter versatilis (strain Ellin345) TaxID=204669 RepID=Q1IP13_KORVE|nr:LacI family DNA-binding transcriptional regulator [Candidatus Koribacter versatilis]ABF41387.1 transcriptional regulator, LacI family [Candidatus Koribacter versatilis Ellin345]
MRLRDVADYLGLSSTTVSLVLNNSPVAKTLSEETRERVRKAAEKLSYKPNYFARALNQKRNYQIGILVPDFGEGYNTSFMTNIERELVERGYLYFVSSHHWNPEAIDLRLRSFVERGVEGVILINTPLATLPDVPLVVVGSQKLKFRSTQISLDNEAGVNAALRHLYALGHRHIAFVKGHEGSVDAEPRWRAFVDGCCELGLRIDSKAVVQLHRIDDGLDPIAEGYKAAETLLASGARFTAVVAFNDMSAIGAMRKFKDAGIDVPGRISIVGFDNVPIAGLVDPPLTTISQPIEEMARVATAEVIAQIETSGSFRPKQVVVEPELVVRRSTTALIA